jgi:Tol biopolymer transport system component
LYWMRADGSGEAVRLTENKNYQFPSSFSPDGRQLAFSENSPQSNWDLWTLRLEAGESDHPKATNLERFLATPFNEEVPMISPDGRWIAYQSDESGAMEVYVRRFAGTGGKWEISTGGGDSPVWVTNGQKLFYSSRAGIMMANYTANGGVFDASKPRVWVARKDLRSFDLAPDGKRLAAVQELVSEQSGTTQVICLLNFFDELRKRAPAAEK